MLPEFSEIGFQVAIDIATALSVIGGVIYFGIKSRVIAIDTIRQERESIRIKALANIYEDLDYWREKFQQSLRENINSGGDGSNVKLTEMYEAIRRAARGLMCYGTMEQAQMAIDASDSFLSTFESVERQQATAEELVVIVDTLCSKILVNVRHIYRDEKPKDSTEIRRKWLPYAGEQRH